MNVPGWESYDLWLSETGAAAVLQRVTGDVDQHAELYRTLQGLGYLGPPKLWTPQSTGQGKYAG